MSLTLRSRAAADLTPPGSPPLPLRLVSSGNQTALDAAARAGLVAAGRLEVQWGGVWGGVCSTTRTGTWDWWADQHAQVVCRQLGYADGHAYRVGSRKALLPGPPPADQPQFITYVQCNGSEPGLGACRGLPINQTRIAPSNGGCRPEDAVQVACYSQKRKWWSLLGLRDARVPLPAEASLALPAACQRAPIHQHDKLPPQTIDPHYGTGARPYARPPRTCTCNARPQV